MSPVVSILVPTYNRSQLLKKTIDSILAQTYLNYEIIIVDNCSTDETEDTVNEFDDIRIRYYKNNCNIGAIHNHNRALRLAVGKYICTFSDDDIMLPDNLFLKVEVLESFPQVGLVHSCISSIDEKGSVTSNGHWNAHTNAGKAISNKSLMTASEAYDLLYNEWNFISMPSVLIRKSVLDEYRLEFNNQLEYLIDWDLWIKLAKHTNFFYLKNSLVFYRSHSNNESSFLNKYIYIKELFLIKLSLVSANVSGIDLKNEITEIYQSILDQLIVYDKFFSSVRPKVFVLKRILERLYVRMSSKK